MELAKETLIELYYRMCQTRKFEEKAAYLFSMGQVHGTAHFCIGEEGAGVGAAFALEPDDLVYATHRGHGQCIGKGMDINRMMAEFLGKSDGYCRGKGGCMHIAGLDVGNLGSNGIVAAGIPISVGAALSSQMQRLDRVVLSFMGDGATNEGAFHEALNLASIWKLPIIFLCINNQYGMSMSVSQSMNIKDIAIRAKSYGIPGKTIDGNNARLVYATVRQAREEVKKDGPQFIVCQTYRIMGHSKSDPNVYRSKEEIKAWKEKCPLQEMRTYLLDQGILDEAALKDLEDRAAADIEAAQAFAEASPVLPLTALHDDLYA